MTDSMEIEVLDPGPRALATSDRSLGGIANLEQYIRVADVVCKTAMVPSGLRNKPGETLAVMLYGAELNIGPMQACQQINFIAGKPSASAELLRALVMEAGHQFILSTSPQKAVARCKRKDWDEWQEVEFTWVDAERAKLTGGENWKKYPSDMLSARVTSKACRMFFPDVISGMSYVPEEVESFSQPQTRVRVQPQAVISRPSPLVPLEGEEPFEQPANFTDGPITEAHVIVADKGEVLYSSDEPPARNGVVTQKQLGMIGALLKEVGIPEDRDIRLGYVADVIGRKVESSKEMTKKEASTLIEALIAERDADKTVVDAEIVDTATGELVPQPRVYDDSEF